MYGYIPPVERRPRMWLPKTTLPLSTPASSRVAARDRRSVVSTLSGKGRRSRRGLIIDLDDTLYPRERFVQSGLAAVARHVHIHHGVPLEDAYAVMARATARGGAGLELQALCDRLAVPSATIATLVEIFRGHTPTLFLPAVTHETLRTMRAQGWALAVLTNGLPSVQFRKIAALGLAALVDDVIYAEEHAAGGKPSVAAFRAALRGLDLEAAECVCIGDDAARDVRGARALGIATIRLARPGVSVAAADEADLVIDSLRQLPDAAALLLRTVTADVA
jgi:putative hydrolase of the HAD superfamily